MDYLKYMTESEYDLLIKNGENQDVAKDDMPLLKLFLTNTDFVWLITELSPTDPDIAFGLCDLGMGFPEIGYVSLSEIEDCQGVFQYLERDHDFIGKYSISTYARAARSIDRVTTDDTVVSRFVAKPKP